MKSETSKCAIAFTKKDLSGAEAALRRAAHRARERALQSGHEPVVSEPEAPSLPRDRPLG